MNSFFALTISILLALPFATQADSLTAPVKKSMEFTPARQIPVVDEKELDFEDPKPVAEQLEPELADSETEGRICSECAVVTSTHLRPGPLQKLPLKVISAKSSP